MSIVLRNCARVSLPEHFKSEVLGLYLHYNNKGETIRNYKYRAGVAYLPLNMDKLKYVSKLLGEDIVDERSAGEPLHEKFSVLPSFKFRDHQAIPAAQLLQHCLENKYGVLSAECGAGKSCVMAWTAGQLQGKTLILVDMAMLLEQWVLTYEFVWGRKVQTITSSTKEFADICICTFQLLNSNPGLVTTMKDMFTTLILDEFHSVGSDLRREILFKMNNNYRLGCTASLQKKGFSDDVLTDFVSSVSVKMVDATALKSEVTFVKTDRPWYSSDPSQWGKISSKLAKDEKRNQLIASIVLEQVKAGRKILLIGITIEQLKYIDSIIKKVPACRSIVYVGSTTLAQDRKLKEDVESGVVNVLATVHKLNKGVDVPSLDCLILTRPINNFSGVVQIAGRIVRLVAGKPNPIVIDLLDANSLSECFARNRRKWYKQLGYSFTDQFSTL